MNKQSSYVPYRLSRSRRLTSHSAPISSDRPFVLYEDNCTPMLFSLDGELVLTSPAITLSPQWENQGSCSMYSDSSCSNKVSSASMVTSAGVGTSLTTYFKCAAANADVTLDPFFFLYGGARMGPPAVVMSAHPSVTIDLSGQFGIDDTLLSTPVVAIRDFFWSSDVPLLVQHQCSSALVAYVAPYASQRWSLGLTKTKSDCALYSDPYCSVPLAKDVLSVLGSSAAVYIRCSSAGSLTVTAAIQGGEVHSSVMTVICASTGSMFDFSFISLSESNPLPSASNTLKLTVRPATSELVAGDTITVNGLVNMSTASTGSLRVSGAQAALFGSTAVWSQGSGTLVLTVATGRTVSTSSDTVVSFSLDNPSAFSNSKPYFTTSKMTSREWPAAPLLASGWAGFAVKTVTSADRLPGYLSMIAVTMRPNRPLSGPQTIKIFNLAGARVEPSEVLRGTGASLFAYEWSDADGMLTLTLLSSKTMPSDSNTTVMMRVLPPVIAQNGVVPSIQLGDAPVQPCDSTLTVTMTQYFAQPSSKLTASEDNPVPGAANRVKLSFAPEITALVADMNLYITFTPPLNIPSGTTNLNPSSDVSPVPVASTGHYDSSEGVLTVPITRAVSKNRTSSVTIDFTNPSSQTDGFYAQISAEPPLSGYGAYNLVSAYKLGTASAAFQKLEMVETVRTASSVNNLVFRLRPTFNTPFHKMEIGPFSWVSSILDVNAPGVSLAFDSATKRVSLTASSMMTLYGGEDYIFSFTITNPSTAQTGSLALYFSSDLGLPATYVADIATQSNFSLSTSPHGLDVTTVTESCTLPGQSNTLTFTLRPTVTMTSGTVYIRYLYRTWFMYGPSSWSVQPLAVTGEHAAVFGSVASWSEFGGTLELTIAAGQSLDSTATSSFAVSIMNPYYAQPPMAPEISIDGTNYVRLAGFVLAVGGGFSKKEWQMQRDPFDEDLCSFAFDLLPLSKIVGPVVISGLAGGTGTEITVQNPDIFSAVDSYYDANAGTLTLTFSPMIRHDRSSRVTFKGTFTSKSFNPMISCCSQDTNFMPMEGTNGGTALWQDTNNEPSQTNQIAFYFQPQTDLPAGSTISFSLYSAGADSSIASELMGAQAGVFNWTGRVDQYSIALIVAPGMTLSAAYESEVIVTFVNLNPSAMENLLMWGPFQIQGMTHWGFSIRNVQKFPSPSTRSGPGTILFTLRPYLDVRKTAKIIISGLHCIAPYDGAVTITDVPEVVATSGLWDGTAGTLTLTVTAAGGMLSTQTYSFQLSVLDVEQVCDPKISLHYRHAVPLRNLVRQAPSTFGSPLSTVLVTESSTALGGPNTLTFSLRPMFQLASGSTILIDSLYHSTTPSSEVLKVSGADAAAFGSVANWTQSQGSLLLTVAPGQTMIASRDSVISVTLTNPETLKIPTVPRVWSNYETPVPANRGVLGGALSTNAFSSVVCPVCGDGLRSGGESCDDGNTINGDGCSSRCDVEIGHICTGGSRTTTDTCSSVPSLGAPVFVTLFVSSITSKSFLLSVQMDVSSTVYYVLDSSTSSTPSLADIKNLKSAGGGRPLRSAKIQYDVSSGQIDKFVLLFGNSKPVKYNLYLYVVNKATGVGEAAVTTLLVDVSAPPSKTVSAPISCNSKVNVPAIVVVTLSEPVPTGNLKVNIQLAGPQTGTTTVTPSTLVFAGPKVSLSFTIVGKVEGVAFVVYTLSGTSADEFSPPAHTTCSFGGSDIVVKPLASGQTSVDLQVSGQSTDAASDELIHIQFDPSTVPDITSLRLQFVTFSTKADSKSTADGEELQNPFDSNQAFAGTSFSLSAYSSTDLRESTSFDSPLLITASYTYLDSIKASSSEKQSALLKYYDTETQSWLVASESCPEALRLIDNSVSSAVLSVNVCHLTHFAIFYTASKTTVTVVDVTLIVGLCFAGAGTVLLLVLIRRVYKRRQTAKDKETRSCESI